MDFGLLIEQIKHFYEPQLTLGLLAEVLFIVTIGVALASAPSSSFSLAFEILYEKISDLFVGILGDEDRQWVKTYVIGLFFVILLSNIFGLLLDFIAPMLGTDEVGGFVLHHYIHHITSDINFNFALALTSIVLVLGLQFYHLGLEKALYTYFPIFGKGIFQVKKESLSKGMYYPVLILIKLCDITISVFLGLLEIVGLLAKVFSLTFRLFGNMAAGSLLLVMIFSFMTYMSTFMGGIDFPIGLPIILYLQGLLVALVQAFVFPLLISVFIVVGREETASA